MTDHPLISVIIPVYNTASFIDRCVLSVLQQDYSDFELLLVNDGSTDDSLDHCQKFADQDSRVKVFSKKNGGVSSARNFGLRQSSGDYVCFIDSDDWVEPDYLSLFAENRQKNGLVACGVTSGEKNKIRDSNNRRQELSGREAQISVLSVTGMHGFPFNKLFDNHLLKEHHLFFDEKITICEDLLFVMAYLSYATGKVIFFEKPTYHYEATDAGAMNSRLTGKKKFDEKQLSEFTALEKAGQYISPNKKVQAAYRQRKTKAAVNSLRILAVYGLQNDPKYKKYYQHLLHIVRSHFFSYITSPYTMMSARVSVLLSAVSPALELYFWKWHHN